MANNRLFFCAECAHRSSIACQQPNLNLDSLVNEVIADSSICPISKKTNSHIALSLRQTFNISFDFLHRFCLGLLLLVCKYCYAHLWLRCDFCNTKNEIFKKKKNIFIFLVCIRKSHANFTFDSVAIRTKIRHKT